MDGEKWTPLDSKTGGRMPVGAPVEGVPDWLAQVLWSSFVRNCLPAQRDAIRFSAALDDVSLLLQLNLGVTEYNANRIQALQKAVLKDRELFLRVVDWGISFKPAGAAELASVLEKAGSAWVVAPDGRGLSRRVLPEAQAAAEHVVQSGTSAGVLIGQAWRHIYGPNPNATAGYDKAVRAAEAVATQAIIPNDKEATLGRVIGILKKRPPGKFGTVFKNARDTDPMDAIIALMELLWTNNYARHASDPSVPIDVTPQEAEAALHASVTLVQWFQRRFVGQEPI